MMTRIVFSFAHTVLMLIVGMAAALTPAVADDAAVMEAFPDEIQARLEARDRHLRRATPGDLDGHSLEFVIETVKRWTPGQTVRVAFHGGDSTLHHDIAEVAAQWTSFGNLKLDFGHDEQTGNYRNWSPSDAAYVAEIRISFNYDGYWSLVGNDSANPAIIRPGQASMNFSAFDVGRPATWRGTVLHEFGHALGLHHEHQHPLNGCDGEFRWDDDPGYTPTTNADGVYVADAQGLRPGLYTVLGGPPNGWPAYKVDRNLRQLDYSSHAFEVGPFDSASIMKYAFGAWMFKNGDQSYCFTNRNEVLSAGDRTGIAKAYPHSPEQCEQVIHLQRLFLQSLNQTKNLNPALKMGFQEQLESLPRD